MENENQQPTGATPPPLPPPLPEQSPIVTPQWGPPPTAPPPPTIGKALLGLVLIFIATLWTALGTFLVYRVFTPEALSYWFGSMLFPFLIAYLIAGVKKRRHFLKFSIFFFVFAVLMSIVADARQIENSLTHSHLSDLSNADIMKEVTGTKPIDPNLPGNEKEMTAIFKSVIGDINAVRKSHDAQMADINPVLAQLYSTQSFSSKDSMQQSLDAINKKMKRDRDMEAAMDQLPDKVKALLAQSTLSDSDKSNLMTNFMKTYASSEVLAETKKLMAAETSWADSSSDLYTYALQHTAQIKASNNKLIINDVTVRTQFNNKIQQSGKFRDDYVAESKTLEALRNDILKNAGVTPTDLGLGK